MNASEHIHPDQLLKILFQSPNAIAVYSGSEITIISANEAMLKLWGRDRSVIGRNLLDAVPELSGQPFIGILKEVWRSGETYLGKNIFAVLNVDGLLQDFYFDFEYKPILDADGKTSYILHTAFEVSARIAAENEVIKKALEEQRLNGELLAVNEQIMSTNAELSALNEEYESANEHFLHYQNDLQLLNEDLNESEERFRLLVENAPVAIAIYRGVDMIIEQANEAMLEIWGQSPLAIGMPLLEARPELKGHSYVDVIRRVIDNGTPHFGYDIKGPVTRNGAVIDGYFDVTYKPIPLKNGGVSGIIVVAVDVTERTLARMREKEITEELTAINEELTASNEELLQAQEHQRELYHTLAASDERFSSMLEQSPVAMASLKGPEFIVDAINPAMLEIWGKDKLVKGLTLADAIPELEGQRFNGILQEVYHTGNTFYGKEIKASVIVEGQLVDRFLNFIYQPVKGLDGKSSAILIIASDVTEQVEARRSVDEINTRLQIALDASGLGSTEVHLESGKMQSTDQFKRVFGYLPEEEFSYPDLFNAMLPEHRDRVKGLMLEAIRTNGIYHTDYPIRWRDGSMHWIRAHGRPRYDEHGKADRMVGMTADITETKQFEQRREDFLSIASHELKTPITSLKASIQLLDRIKEKPFSPIHTKLIEQSGKSVEKMGVLVDELLNMSRMSEEQLKLERTTFNLYDMLSNSCTHVRLEGKHKLVIEGDKELKVYADEHRIDQVVINFVNNAVKYAPDSKEIHLFAQNLGNHVKVSVRDFGKGIDNTTLPNLFDRYFRVDHSGKAYSGLGLGLYICSEIIKKHGGTIGAESVIGEGSTFWFILPV